jgi:hypothetical protein
MAKAGRLEIEMVAGLARLAADMGKAVGIVSKSNKQIETSIASVKSALNALGLGLSVVGFTTMIKGSIDAMDKLNDLSKATGLTVEQLSGLKLAAKQSGGDLDSIATSINKLSVEMGKSPEKFKALGISAKDPLEAFKQLSDVFVRIENPQQRAAVAAVALGKSWAGAAPLLAEGSAKIAEMVEKGTLLSGVTTADAKAADEFNDKMVELNTSFDAARNHIAIALLPGLTNIANEMNRAAKEGGALYAVLVGIANLGKFALFGAPDDIERQVDFIKDLDQQIALLQKKIGDKEGKGPIQSWLSGGDLEEMKRRLAELIQTWHAAQKSLSNMKFPLLPGDTNQLKLAPGIDLDKFTGAGQEESAKAAKAAAEALRNKREILKLIMEDEERYTDALEAHNEAAAKELARIRESALAMEDMIAELGLMNDAERAATITKNADIAAAEAEKFKALKESLKTEDELRKFSYETDFDLLQKSLDDKLVAQETYYTLLGRLIKRNEDERARIEGHGALERRQFAAMTLQQQAKDIFGYMADITAGVAQHNRALFEINKVAGIANAIINAYEGISLTLAKYPYPLNIGLAALHAAAAFAQVSAIAQTQFGSSAGAPSLAGGTPATPVTPVTGGTPEGSGQTTIINMPNGGQLISGKQLKQLIDQINEGRTDGNRIVLA